MKKKIFKLFILSLILILAAKGFVAFTAYRMLSSIKEQHSSDFLLTYEWLSSNYDGVVTIEGLQLTPFTMKKTFSVESISFHYSDFFTLLFQLPSLAEPDVKGLSKITIDGVESELKGKGFKDMLENVLSPAWIQPFNLYGCSGYEALTPEAYQRMGLKAWNASYVIELNSSERNTDILSVSIDQNGLGKTKIVTEWPKRTVDTFLQKPTLDALTLLSLDIEHQDTGFFRRLNILCNEKETANRDIFSRYAAITWKNAMYEQGLVINDVLLELYADFLLQGGILSLTVSPKEGLEVTKLDTLVNKELVTYLNMAFKLNGQKLKFAEIFLDGSIIFPPVVEPSTEGQEKVQEPKVEPGYRTFELEQANEVLGRKIRISMLDGKTYEGLLRSTTEYNLELTQNLPGGSVHYPLMLNEIQTFEVWVNQ